MTAIATKHSQDRLPDPADSAIIRLCERGYLPDRAVRAGMRLLMRQRLRDEFADDGERRAQACAALLAELRASPIAIETQSANTQHYEVPAAFFEAHLGPFLKYSSGYYPVGNESLGEGERAMLGLYASRAGLEDGQRILDLGCGWGSLSLWLAERYPRSQIVALSNSTPQRLFIEKRAAERGLTNVQVVTGNIVDFEFDPAITHVKADFDRVLSVEMFEHMKNYGLLLAKISRWLRDDGQLFVHIFAHRTLAYHFAVRDQTDWMSRYFFTGGTMPSAALLLNFQDDVRVKQQWWVNGTHYERTANQWLEGLDAARDRVMSTFSAVYGTDAGIWFQRWRMFYMAVAELFGYAEGSEWGVAHYLFEKRAQGRACVMKT